MSDDAPAEIAEDLLRLLITAIPFVPSVAGL